MDVHAAQPRQHQRRARQDQAVSHDDQDVGLPGSQIRPVRLALQRRGWATGNAALERRLLTGLAASCRPRPFGRSGCVSTPTTVWRERLKRWQRGQRKIRRSRERDAQPVMLGTTRLGSVRRPTGPGRGCASPAPCALSRASCECAPLEVGQVVDEQLALEVIHLVLDADGQNVLESRSNTAPVRSWARTRIFAARSTSSKIPGTDRQPSSVSATPSRDRISGLMNTSGSFRSSDTSMTIRRLWTSTWVAARPIPGRGVHGLEHVVDQLSELGIELGSPVAHGCAAADRGIRGWF